MEYLIIGSVFLLAVALFALSLVVLRSRIEDLEDRQIALLLENEGDRENILNDVTEWIDKNFTRNGKGFKNKKKRNT